MIQTDLICIFGPRGSGKSTLAKELQRGFPRLVVADLMGEYEVDRKNPLDFEAVGLENLARVMIAITRAGLDRYRVVFRWPEGSAPGFDEFNRFFELVYRFGNSMLVLEEVWYYMKREHMPAWLQSLVFRGRHPGVGILATSQRPAQVSKDFTSQCQHVFVGRFFDRNDVKYFTDSLAVDESQIRRLENFTFLCFLNSALTGKIKTTRQK